MRERTWEIGITIATNTVLFTSLDLGQWIADKLSLWTLPANVVAAVIATAFGLALTAAAQMFGTPAANAAASVPATSSANSPD